MNLPRPTEKTGAATYITLAGPRGATGNPSGFKHEIPFTETF